MSFDSRNSTISTPNVNQSSLIETRVPGSIRSFIVCISFLPCQAPSPAATDRCGVTHSSSTPPVHPVHPCLNYRGRGGACLQAGEYVDSSPAYFTGMHRMDRMGDGTDSE